MHMASVNDFLAPRSTLAARLTAVVESVRAARARRAVYRETYAELARLSDRDLADLGLHRAEIDQIARDAARDL
jgi:uncharacterized protein YjiS (DUF1127 family)